MINELDLEGLKAIANCIPCTPRQAKRWINLPFEALPHTHDAFGRLRASSVEVRQWATKMGIARYGSNTGQFGPSTPPSEPVA